MHKMNLKPFIKYAGGKQKLIHVIKELYPDVVSRYYEPFVGSGAVFLNIKVNLNPKTCVISDINSNLTACYLAIRDYPYLLLKVLTRMEEEINSRAENDKVIYYNKVRETYNNIKDSDSNLNDKTQLVDIASHYIFLNKTCFNGLYRENKNGKFNVPFNKSTTTRIVTGEYYERLELISRILNDNVDIYNFDLTVDDSIENFYNLIEKNERSFCYFDPPYRPISLTAKFTQYHKNGFSDVNHKALAKLFKRLDKDGIKLMLSISKNSDGFIEGLYKDFCMRTIYVGRSINCDPSKRAKIEELLITNY
jgi:DNA adenine methylase